MNRKHIFDFVRDLLEDKGLPGRFTQEQVDQLDDAIDRALQETGEQLARESGGALSISPKGIALMHKWEGCHKLRPDGRYEAYPDPGSIDGTPWTIGWGSTGPGIRKGTVWTKAQCNARFERDLGKYAADVKRALGTAPTTQGQFDALVSFHYNTGAIFKATLTRKHKEGDYAGAKREFGKWIFNDGKRMQGLANRRADEAELYGG